MNGVAQCTSDETRCNQWVLDLELAVFARYKRELDHFWECVLEGKTPLTSGLDGRKAIEVSSAVYLSAFLGEKIQLPRETTPDLARIFDADSGGLRMGVKPSMRYASKESKP